MVYCKPTEEAGGCNIFFRDGNAPIIIIGEPQEVNGGWRIMLHALSLPMDLLPQIWAKGVRDHLRQHHVDVVACFMCVDDDGAGATIQMTLYPDMAMAEKVAVASAEYHAQVQNILLKPQTIVDIAALFNRVAQAYNEGMANGQPKTDDELLEVASPGYMAAERCKAERAARKQAAKAAKTAKRIEARLCTTP